MWVHTSSLEHSVGFQMTEFVQTFTVENHKDRKRELLDLISLTTLDIKANGGNVKPSKDGGYVTDFFDRKIPKSYISTVNEVVMPYITKYANSFFCQPNELTKWWFQQYQQGTQFGWHHHNGHVGLIYFLELGDERESTEFANFGQFDVREGDIIIFPSYTVHRAPIIKSNKRKTILACNIDLSVDRSLIQ